MSGQTTAAKNDTDRPLTPKQAAFVREYLIDLNATQAVIRAGYSSNGAEVQGHRLLTYANVAAAVQAGMDARAERTDITADYVLTGIRDVTERCARQGEEFNPPSALKGYELLGKHLKLFSDKVLLGSDPDNPLPPGFIVSLVKPDDAEG